MSPADLSARLAKLQATLPRQIAQALALSALVAEAEGKKNATTLLKVHSGRLRNSIRTEVHDDGTAHQMALRAGGERDVVYARIQELGGTITPRNGKFLAIPLAPALTGAGVSRYKSPRDVPGLSFRGNANRGALVDKAGVPWYALVKSVTIRPKFYLKAALDTASTDLSRRLVAVLSDALGAA
jgi:hypothetical protein